MVKTVIFAILLMITKPVSAASFMTHEKFVLLPHAEQRRIVIGMMELIVEIEGRYKHETKTAGFNSDRYRRYTEVIRKISSFIIAEAQADFRRQRYGQFLNDLSGVLRQSNRCLYGGWISTVGGPNNLCSHPSAASSPEISPLYQSEGGCSGRENITCNPAIFGFKNVQTKTLFCVPAGRAGEAGPFASDNSSRACMLKALATTPEEGASSKEDRINNIINGISLNPNDANNTFDFMIKTCACADNTPEIADTYHAYMRPHRTCYSILRMMSEFLPRCQAPQQQFLDANQLSFLEYIKTSLTEQQISQENFEEAYRPIVDQFVSRPDYQAICGAQPADGAVTLTAACPEGQTRTPPDTVCKCSDGSAPPAGEDCPVIVTAARTPPVTTVVPPATIQPPEPCVPATNVRNTEGVCEEPPAVTTPTISLELRGSLSADKGTYDAKINGKAESVSGYTFTWYSEGDDLGTIQFVGVNPLVTSSASTVNLSDVGSPDPTEPAANEAVSAAPAAEDPAPPAAADPAPPAAADPAAADPAPPAAADPAPPAAADPAPPAAADPAPPAAAAAAAPAAADPAAPAAADPAPPAAADPAAPAPAPAPAPAAADPDAATVPSGTTFSENQTPHSTLSSKFSTEAPRLANKNYKICIRLIKTSDNSDVGHDCEEVLKKDAVIAPVVPRNNNGFMGPQMPQQMGPTRGGSSDAIFRGVR